MGQEVKRYHAFVANSAGMVGAMSSNKGQIDACTAPNYMMRNRAANRRRSNRTRKATASFEMPGGLEPRMLFATAPELFSALKSGTSAFSNSANDIMVNALESDTGDLPLIREQLASRAKFGNGLRSSVSLAVAAPTDFNDLRDKLIKGGASVLQCDSSGLRVAIIHRFTPNATSIDVGGNSWSYFNNYARSNLSGSMSLQSSAVDVKLEIGVDKSGFYVGENSSITVHALAGKARLSGGLNIGVLQNVKFSGDAAFSLQGSVKFSDRDSDHRLRLADFSRSRLGQTVQGTVNGAITLSDARFSASILGSSSSFSWSGSFTAKVDRNNVINSESLRAPSYQSVVTCAAGSLFGTTRKIDWVRDVAGFLNEKVPIVNKPIADLLGIRDSVNAALLVTNPGWATSSSFDVVASGLKGLGIELQLNSGNGPSQMNELIRGRPIDILQTTRSGRKDFTIAEYNVPLAEGTVLGIANFSAGFGVKAYAGIDWSLTAGLGTSGFWLGNGSHVGMHAGVSGELYGKADILGGFLGGKLSGRIAGEAFAGVYVADPTPADGRVYLHEVQRTGDIARDVAGVLGSDGKIVVGGKLTAKATALYVLNKSKTLWEKNYTVAEFHRPPTTTQANTTGWALPTVTATPDSRVNVPTPPTQPGLPPSVPPSPSLPTLPFVSFGNGRGDRYLVGDWDGNGKDELAVERNGAIFYQTGGLGSSVCAATGFGNGTFAGDRYLVGDWDGNGSDELAVERNGTIFYQTAGIGNSACAAIGFGNGSAAGDRYLAGDWDGNGRDELAVERNGTIFYQTAGIGSSACEATWFGNGTSGGDRYLTGDWNGDGRDELAVERRNSIYVQSAGIAHSACFAVQIMDIQCDDYLTGDFEGDGRSQFAALIGNRVYYS